MKKVTDKQFKIVIPGGYMIDLKRMMQYKIGNPAQKAVVMRPDLKYKGRPFDSARFTDNKFLLNDRYKRTSWNWLGA